MNFVNIICKIVSHQFYPRSTLCVSLWTYKMSFHSSSYGEKQTFSPYWNYDLCKRVILKLNWLVPTFYYCSIRNWNLDSRVTGYSFRWKHIIQKGNNIVTPISMYLASPNDRMGINQIWLNIQYIKCTTMVCTPNYFHTLTWVTWQW